MDVNKTIESSNQTECVLKQESIDEIIEFLASNEGLDIYQLVAFRVMTGTGCCCCHRKRKCCQHLPDEIESDEDTELSLQTNPAQIQINEVNQKDKDELKDDTKTEKDDTTDKKEEDKENEDEDDENRAACWGYWMDIIKAMICILTQWSSIIVIYYQLFTTKIDESGKGWCDGEGIFSSRIMAISYSLFLSAVLFGTYTKYDDDGFYGIKDTHFFRNEYNFLSPSWLSFGIVTNRLILLNAFYLSFLILFYTEDPLDIVLNSVALLFIADIDNMVVDSVDYEKTLSWFKNEENIKAITMKPVGLYSNFFWTILETFTLFLCVLTFICMFIAPLVIAVCY